MYISCLIALYLPLLSATLPHNNNTTDTCKEYKISEVIQLDDENNLIGYPRYTIDEVNNFILTDQQGHNVKIYDAKGNYVSTFGRRGKGPGDFEHPQHSIRNQDKIHTVTIDGILTTWDIHTKHIYNISDLPLFGVNYMELLNDSLMVIDGRIVDGNKQIDNHLMHLVDLNENKILDSFFPEPEEYLPYRHVAQSMPGLINFKVIDDKIIINYGLSSDLYIYKLAENKVKFDSIQQIKPPEDFKNILELDVSDLMDRWTAFSKFSHINKASILNNGKIAIQVRQYGVIDQTERRTSVSYSLYQYDTNTKQHCLVSNDGILVHTDGKRLFVMDESDYAIIYVYKEIKNED